MGKVIGKRAGKTVNWGVLGAAAIAAGRTMPAMNLAPSATLLAIAARDFTKAEAAAQAHHIPRVHASFDALLADPVFGIDRLSSALLDCGDRHAAFSVATQSGPSGWGTHQQLSVLGAKGWLRFDFPYAHARPSACRIELGDSSSVGSQPTQTFHFEQVNQYELQIERFSRLLLGERVPSWPIEDALDTLAPSGPCSRRRAAAAGRMWRPDRPTATPSAEL